MKKFRWQIIIVITIIGLMVSVKTNNSIGFNYLSAYLFTDYEKTLENLGKKYDIKFVYEIDDSFIEKTLMGVNLNNSAKQISNFELARYSVLLPLFFSKYPDSIIKNDVKTIKLAASLTLFGVSYGGTSVGSTLYLTSSGFNNGYNDLYLEELFHHEFSSILMRNHRFPSTKFATNNPAKFKYAKNVDDILRAITQDTSTTGDNILYKNGFLTKYSMSTLENDVNMYVETIFTKPKHLQNLINNYPAIKNKYLVVKQFYLGINPAFSKTFNLIH